MLEPLAEGGGLLEQLLQTLGRVEGEETPGAVVRIAGVAEVGLRPGALVEEGRLGKPALQVVRQVGLVAGGLVGHAAEGRALRLGLDDAGHLALDEQHVVRGPRPALELPHGHAGGRAEVDLLRVLDHPPSCLQLGVNVLSGQSFRGHGGLTRGAARRKYVGMFSIIHGHVHYSRSKMHQPAHPLIDPGAHEPEPNAQAD
jgi:hypothetical protein